MTKGTGAFATASNADSIIGCARKNIRYSTAPGGLIGRMICRTQALAFKVDTVIRASGPPPHTLGSAYRGQFLPFVAL